MSADAKAPLQSGAVRTLGIIWACLILTLGLVAVREALVRVNLANGPLWLADTARQLDGMGRGPWLLAVAVVSALIGATLLVLVFRPRARVGLAVTSQTPVFLMPSAAASIALASARRVDGVLGASAKTSKNKLDVVVKSTNTDPQLSKQIRNVIGRRLSALESKPKLKLKLRQQKAES